MFNRVSSLILAILMFLVFLGAVSSLNVFALGLAVFIAATFAINLKRLGLSWPHLMLPTIFLIGTGVFAVIPNVTFRTAFLIVSCLVFYFLEMQLGRESHFLQNVYLYSVFAIFSGIYALHFYFRLDSVWVILMILAAAYLLITQGFAGFSLPVKRYFSLLTAIVCAEVAFGLTLWPTYFVVNAVITLAVFYLLWIFSFSAFFGKLTRNKIYWQLGLVAFVIVVVLLTANFKPITT